MAVNDNSLLATILATIGNIIDDSTAIGAEYDTDEVETLIFEGLKEMAIFGAVQNVYLNTSASIAITTKSGSLPADYMYHDIGKVMECAKTALIEPITQEFDRGLFDRGDKAGRNYFLIEGKSMKVNSGDITAVTFEYIKTPTMLTTSSITNEFEPRMYNFLPHYVIGKLYLRNNSESEQKQMAMHHFVQFYKLIGLPSFKERAEVAVA